jgi:hypothetical protein
MKILFIRRIDKIDFILNFEKKKILYMNKLTN